MCILFILFRINFWQWYGLRAFAEEDLNECQSLQKLVYYWMALGLFRMGLSGLLTDEGWELRQNISLPKNCHTYPTVMKLGTVIIYLKRTQKIYESRTYPLNSADISISSLKISKFCYIRKYRYVSLFGA